MQSSKTLPLSRRLKRVRDGGCTACPLHRKATNVCVPGDGAARHPVLVLGEAPGYNEDQRLTPFVGRAGKYLRASLVDAGLAPQKLWLSNSVKCYPQGTPTKDEIATCSGLFLRREIALLKPAWILALGKSALLAVCEMDDPKVTQIHHRIYPLADRMIPKGSYPSKNFGGHEALVFPTFHPSYVLRMRGTRVERDWKLDLETFSALVSVDLGV